MFYKKCLHEHRLVRGMRAVANIRLINTIGFQKSRSHSVDAWGEWRVGGGTVEMQDDGATLFRIIASKRVSAFMLYVVWFADNFPLCWTAILFVIKVLRFIYIYIFIYIDLLSYMFFFSLWPSRTNMLWMLNYMRNVNEKNFFQTHFQMKQYIILFIVLPFCFLIVYMQINKVFQFS